jgi:hypothetical protein
MIYKRGCNKRGPTGTCSKCGVRGTCGVYWYKFVWQGALVRESTKQRNDKVARNMESATVPLSQKVKSESARRFSLQHSRSSSRKASSPIPTKRSNRNPRPLVTTGLERRACKSHD